MTTFEILSAIGFTSVILILFVVLIHTYRTCLNDKAYDIGTGKYNRSNDYFERFKNVCWAFLITIFVLSCIPLAFVTKPFDCPDCPEYPDCETTQEVLIRVAKELEQGHSPSKSTDKEDMPMTYPLERK